MTRLLGKIRSMLGLSLVYAPEYEQQGGGGHRRSIVALGVVVSLLQFPALILGPVFAAVTAFFLVGTWLGYIESFMVVNGWVIIAASLLYVVLRVLGKHIDRKLRELDGKTDTH